MYSNIRYIVFIKNKSVLNTFYKIISFENLALKQIFTKQVFIANIENTDNEKYRLGNYQIITKLEETRKTRRRRIFSIKFQML